VADLVQHQAERNGAVGVDENVTGGIGLAVAGVVEEVGLVGDAGIGRVVPGAERIEREAAAAERAEGAEVVLGEVDLALAGGDFEQDDAGCVGPLIEGCECDRLLARLNA
jgi:hypothetical protein